MIKKYFTILLYFGSNIRSLGEHKRFFSKTLKNPTDLKLFNNSLLVWLIHMILKRMYLQFVLIFPVKSLLLGHPRFFNQLSSGLDIIGLAGEWLTSTANTNM